MELTERKLKILQAIINDYVMSAEPVGSRTLAREFNNVISPATIRNEMSDLEAMGYLTHPHTSAGRVPSDKAYRLYVNDMMGREELPEESKRRIRETLRADVKELDRTIQHAAELLSEITNLASFAMSPTQKQDKLEYVNLIPVDARQIVLMTIAESGKSSSSLLRVDVPYTQETLNVIAKSLTYDYKGKNLTDVLRENLATDARTDITAMSQLTKNIMPNFLKTLESLLNINLYMDGIANIFDLPEFSDTQRAKGFVSKFENEGRTNFLKELTERDDGVIVTIGDENPDVDMKDCSVITATYHVNGKYAGKIGVIGPTRMNYGRVTSVMQYLTENLNAAFRMDDEEDNDER